MPPTGDKSKTTQPAGTPAGQTPPAPQGAQAADKDVQVSGTTAAPTGAQATPDASAPDAPQGDPKDSGAAKVEKSNAAERAGQANGSTAPAGIVVRDGKYSGSLGTADDAGFVTIDEDVSEEFYFPGTNRPSYRLLFHKGQVVPKSALPASE